MMLRHDVHTDAQICSTSASQARLTLKTVMTYSSSHLVPPAISMIIHGTVATSDPAAFRIMTRYSADSHKRRLEIYRNIVSDEPSDACV